MDYLYNVRVCYKGLMRIQFQILLYVLFGMFKIKNH
jgi:hypothetical protein